MNKKKKAYIFYLLIIAFLIYIIFIDSYSFFKLYNLKRSYQKLYADLEKQREENKRLKKENEELKTNNRLLEKEARKLGMQKRGEEIFLFKEENKQESHKIN